MTEVLKAEAPPEPGSDEWVRVVTASKVSAITGTSPWESAYSLWHTMRGNIQQEVKASRAIERGNFLEDGIIDWFFHTHPGIKEVGRQVWTSRAKGLEGCTLDALGDEDGTLVPVEAKTAARGEDWGPEGSDIIPLHYRDQMDWQLSFYPDAPHGYVVALLGPSLDLRWYKVPRDEERIESLQWQVNLFRWSLEADQEPPLDRSVATLSTIRAIHPLIEQDEDVEIDPGLAQQFVSALAAEKAAIERATGAKSRLLKEMGTARRAMFGGKVVARRQPNRSGVSLVPVMKPDTLAEVCKSVSEESNE